MNLDELAEQLHNDLARYSALKNKGLKAYFKEYNRQTRQKNIHAISEKLEREWGSDKLEKQDAAFDALKKYGEN